MAERARMPERYRLMSYYLDKLRRLESEYADRPAETLETFERDWDTVTRVHRRILSGIGDDPRSRRFCMGYARHGWRLLTLQRPATVPGWIGPALECVRSTDKRRLEARLLRQLAATHLKLGNHLEAEEAGKSALDVLEKLDDDTLEHRAETSHLLGQARRNAGNDAEADPERDYERALELARQAGNPCLEGRIRIDLGNIRANRGRYQDGLEQYDIAKSVMDRGRCRDRRPDDARRLGYIGNAQRNLGNLDQAIEAYKQSIRLLEELGDPQQTGVQQYNLALAYRDRGDLEPQKGALEAAVKAARATADERGMAKAHNGLGTYWGYIDDLGQAIEFHHEGLTRIQDVRARFIEGYVHADLATTLLLFDRALDALDHLFPALEIAAERQHALLVQQRRTLIARCHLHRRELLLAREQLELAREHDASTDTAGSRHATAVLHGVVLLRLAQNERGADSRASLLEQARAAFDAALDDIGQTGSPTAQVNLGLANAGLAAATDDASEQARLVARAQATLGTGLGAITAPRPARHHRQLLAELLDAVAVADSDADPFASLRGEAATLDA